jgi:hypothetical protein
MNSATGATEKTVLSFFSSRPNWDFLAPSHAGECVPPPLVSGGGGGGGGTIACGREGGVSQFRREDRHCGTLVSRYICTLWLVYRT